VSVANAIGVMQVIPSAGAWASSLAGRRLDLLDTRDNITAGVVILRSLTRSATTEEQAVAGYYQGLAGVRAHGMYADTRSYVRSVLALKARM
jgi:soluble lytic murein transglycosylase-like protein